MAQALEAQDPALAAVPGRELHADMLRQYLGALWQWGQAHAQTELQAERLAYNEAPRPDSRGPLPAEAIAWMEGRRELLGKWDRDLDALVQVVISESLRDGATLQETIAALREIFPTFSESRLETIARTESTAAYTQGRLAEFLSPGSGVVAFQLSAILDSRTTEICKARDGLVIRADDPRLQANLPPLHYRCRTVIIPITRATWKRLEAGDKRTVDRIFGWVPEGGPTTLEEALARLDEAPPPLPGFGGTEAPTPVTKTSTLKEAVETRKAQGIKDHDDARDVGRIVAKEIRSRLNPELRRSARQANRAAAKIRRSLDRARYLEADAREKGFSGTELRVLAQAVREAERENAKAKRRAEKAKAELAVDRRRHTLAALREVRPLGGVPQRWSTGSFTAVKDAVKQASAWLPADWLLASSDFGQLLGVSGVRGGYSRGLSSTNARLRVSKGSLDWMRRVALHEMGHRVEHVIQDIGQMSLAYLESRTQGETSQLLSSLTGVKYGPSEVTKRDRFTEPYIGKDYGGIATEILSMALEGIFYSRYDIWEQDESLLEYVLGVLTAL